MSLWRLLLQDLVIDSRVTSIRHQPLEGMVRSPKPSQSLRLGFGIDCPKKLRFQVWFCLNICKKNIVYHHVPYGHVHPFSNTPMCICWRLRQSFGMVFPSWHFFGPFFRATNKDSIFSLPNMESATRVSYREMGSWWNGIAGNGIGLPASTFHHGWKRTKWSAKCFTLPSSLAHLCPFGVSWFCSW